jgi:hypothetical protein
MTDPDAPRRLLENARNEAVRTLLIWALALIWTVGWCWLFGYRHSPDSWLVQNGIVSSRSDADFRQIAGLPDWVAIGIILPWIICTVLTVIFSLRGMADDDLGREAEDAPPPGIEQESSDARSSANASVDSKIPPRRGEHGL